MAYKMDEMTSAAIEHEVSRWEDEGGSVVNNDMLDVASQQLLRRFANYQAKAIAPYLSERAS